MRMSSATFRNLWALLSVCLPLLCLPADQQTVIRTAVHVVEVSVVAVDAKGAPAADLDTHELRVFDNGKEQTIASFEQLSSPPGAGGAELRSNVYSNRIGEAGPSGLGKKDRPQILSMILLDTINTKYRNQTVARRAVENILDQLQPGERVAIFALGDRLRVIHDFSSDRASLLARLRAYHGEVPFRDDLLEDLDLDTKDVNGKILPACAPVTAPETTTELTTKNARILDTLEALEALANHVKGLPGRKNLLWMSAAFPLEVGKRVLSGPIVAPTASNGRTSPFQDYRAYGGGASGGEMDRTMAALNNANVSVYPVDARGLSCNPEAIINIDTMKSIADATGGKAFYNRNDLAQGVRDALDDSREVYLLTYSPTAIAQDGAYHSIRVQTTRRGVTLRYRRGYYAPGRQEPGAAGTPDRLTRVLSSPLDASGIGIQASAEETPGAGDGVRVAIRIDAVDLNLTPNEARWTGALHLEAIQTGAAGEHLGGVSQAAELNLEPATYQRALQQGLTFSMRFQREPAAVAVRIGVIDERGGQVGSLSVPLRTQPAPGARSPAR